MAKRIFRIEFGSMGGELVIGKVDEQFVENWTGKSSDELVEYLHNWDFRDTNQPSDEFNPLPKENFNAWNELDDIEHANNCYSDAGIFVNEVKEDNLYVALGELMGALFKTHKELTLGMVNELYNNVLSGAL